MMMKSNLLLIILLLTVGCRTIQRSQKVDVSVEDRELSVSYRPRTVVVPLPQDTVYVESPVAIVERENHAPLVVMDTIFSTKGIITAKAWIDSSIHFMEAYLTDSTIIYQNDSLQEVVDRLQIIRINDNVTETKIVKRIPAIGWIGIAFFVLMLISKIDFKL